MGDQPVAAPIGCGAVVRTLTDIKVGDQPAGAIGLVVGQAPNGPNRYSVMFPGDAFTYSLAAKDVEVLRGLDRQSWWKKQPVQPSASPDAPDQTATEEQVLKERDHATDWADRLAYAIAPESEIGEHSSANDPWANALEIAEQRHLPVVDSDLRDQVAQALHQKSCLEYPNRGFGCASPEQHWQAWLDEADAALAVFVPALRKAWLDGHDAGVWDTATNVSDPRAKEPTVAGVAPGSVLDDGLRAFNEYYEADDSYKSYGPIFLAEIERLRQVVRVSQARDKQTLALKLRNRNREYGRASATIGQLRAELARERQRTANLLTEVKSWIGQTIRADGEAARARDERDELRAHGVARDIGEANDRMRADLEEAYAKLAAFKAGVRLFWLPEFGDDEEIELGEPTVHNRHDGRFVLRGALPDTEATEQAAPMCKCPGGDHCRHRGSEQPVTPATPTEPRVWRKADPEPAGVSKVRDCMGDIWTLQPFGVWEAPDTRPASWNYMVKKWAPLTEVVDGAPAEDKP